MNTHEAQQQQSLRLWPGVVTVALQWLLRFIIPVIVPAALIVGIFGGLAGGLAVIIWWAFFSRAPRSDRVLGGTLMVVALLVTSQLLHKSIATAMMGLMYAVYALPILSLAFVVWALICRGLPDRPRRTAMVATILLACGFWVFLRTDGMTGDVRHDFAWRWSETPEDRFLAQGIDEPSAAPPGSPAAETGPEWPGFRGPGRDSVIPGVLIDTDWTTSPPVELWRRSVGPGWSSCAVHGDLLYTQEQHGDDEVVSCYDATTGEPVWRHRYAARFWESHAGPGPRGTPTLSEGRVYTFGATGILNVLDAADGALVWSRDAAADTDVEIPYWGLASSPLMVGDVVIVAVSGQLAAYDRDTGEPRWSGPDSGHGYSSPHLLSIDGVAQILLPGAAGVASLAPADGTVLWEHSWPADSRIVQPALTADGDLLIGTSDGVGVRRVAVTHRAGGWRTEERWTSNRLKPEFNDFVVHEGHAYGFDGTILACIDVDDGKRKWKGGRYGSGQLVLLADQGLLLVVSEQGELALVAASPDQFEELARFPAITGKTWNHPVLVDDLLLVRNAQEMAAFRLSLAEI